MHVEKEVAPELSGRRDLIQIMDAAADFLAARDTDPDTRARARWRLWRDPNAVPWIGLQLDEEEHSSARQFRPGQLTDAEDRQLRLISIWNDVLRERARREVRRVDELLSQYQGG